MEFGNISIIFSDTNFNNIRTFMGCEFKADHTSKILITYNDNSTDITELDMNFKSIFKGSYYTSGTPNIIKLIENKNKDKDNGENVIDGLIFNTLFKDEPLYPIDDSNFIPNSLHNIFNKHFNWFNKKSSYFNCSYYVFKPSKIYTFSILKIGSSRFLFAYNPIYLNKNMVQNIIFHLFTSDY